MDVNPIQIIESLRDRIGQLEVDVAVLQVANRTIAEENQRLQRELDEAGVTVPEKPTVVQDNHPVL